jgi:hypothetical protein
MAKQRDGCMLSREIHGRTGKGNQSAMWVAEQRDNGKIGRWVATVNWGWVAGQGYGCLNKKMGG